PSLGSSPSPFSSACCPCSNARRRRPDMVSLDIRPPSVRVSRGARLLGSSALPAVSLGLITTVIVAIGSWIPSLWGDEAASVLSAERPLPSLFRMLGHVDAVHGTYYFLLHFWVALFGASPFSVR